ncbi:MAG TPA: TonB-dependent receptor, partial [Alicycliphilus sp.]|nr:TonB-dependent receptor [Alicycliphilus sp.]
PQLQAFEGEPFHARVHRMAFYLQDEWEIGPQWSTYLGARVETLKTFSDSSGSRMQAHSRVLTPVLHLNYKFDPKGRDMVRASLTRAYRAPDLQSLMARPSINSSYPVNGPNPENAPDRVGNPLLRPELSTGLDVAFERYFAGGGVMSLGLFHKRIDGLIRQAVTLDTVPWASVPRWVSHPVNLSGARSTGVEFEIKGRAIDLMPALVSSDQVQVRASLSAYRSRVADLPAPYNRLEQQQPWSLTLGFDDKRLAGKLGFGASLAYTPGYTTQQTVAQTQALNRSRTLDLYASWTFSREALLRLSVNNWQALDVVSFTRTQETAGALLSNRNERHGRAFWNAGLSLKF